MDESRLTGLALLHTHKNIIVDIDGVINRFANEKKRYVKLSLWLIFLNNAFLNLKLNQGTYLIIRYTYLIISVMLLYS